MVYCKGVLLTESTCAVPSPGKQRGLRQDGHPAKNIANYSCKLLKRQYIAIGII